METNYASAMSGNNYQRTVM